MRSADTTLQPSPTAQQLGTDNTQPMNDMRRGNALIPLAMVSAIVAAGVGMGYLLMSLRAPPLPTWNSPSPSETAFVDKLVARMTLEEKLGQCNLAAPAVDLGADRSPLGSDPVQALGIFQLSEAQREDLRRGRIGGFIGAAGRDFVRAAQAEVAQSRLGVPLLFGADVLHGYATIFPSPLAETASWNPSLAERTARAAAREATAVGINWTLAPAVDVARDARWRRIAESAGEDVLLASQFAAARVRGFQGEDLGAPDTLAATAKHFIADGAAEGGLDYAPTELSEHTMREVYLPPFQAAVEAGVAVIMTSFNDINGTPGATHKRYLNDILKGELGFGGFVLSHRQISRESLFHSPSADGPEAVKRALEAGIDMLMDGMACQELLRSLPHAEKLDKQRLDDATRRILSVKYRLGLFDDPLRYADGRPAQTALLTTTASQLAREAGRAAIVLLKNAGGLLPLAKRAQKIALIGPFIQDRHNLSDSWLPIHRRSAGVSLYEGIVAARGGESRLRYAQGSGIYAPLAGGIAAAVRAARRSDVVVLALGEASSNPHSSGNAIHRTRLSLPRAQLELARAVIATGVPVAVLLRNGGPLALPWLAQNATAIVETWFLGSETGHAVADILFGDYAPSGRLPLSFPHDLGQEPLYYNHKNTGRPTTALFAFGHGLSYTSFRYEALELDNWLVPPQGELLVTATVRNTGQRDGVTVAQLYLRDLAASVTRPVRALKAYKHQFIKAGETTRVTFTVPERDLRLVGTDQKWISERGRFELFVGPNAATGLQAHFYSIAQQDADIAEPPLPLRIHWDGEDDGLAQALSAATAAGQHDAQALAALYHELRTVAQGGAQGSVAPGSSATLAVRIEGVGGRSGRLWLRLFADRRAWVGGEAVATQRLPFSSGMALASFPRLRPGDYALQLFLDLDSDGQLDVDALGLPTEPVAFSNGAQYTLRGAPSFRAARLALGPGATQIDIAMP